MEEIEMVYLNLEAKEFTPEKIEQMKQKYKSEVKGEDDCLYWEADDTNTRIEDITEDGKLFAISETDIGYISFEVNLSLDDQIKLMELMVKRLNKFKTLMESVK